MLFLQTFVWKASSEKIADFEVCLVLPLHLSGTEDSLKQVKMNKASRLCLPVSRYPGLVDVPGAFRGSVWRCQEWKISRFTAKGQRRRSLENVPCSRQAADEHPPSWGTASKRHGTASGKPQVSRWGFVGFKRCSVVQHSFQVREHCARYFQRLAWKETRISSNSTNKQSQPGFTMQTYLEIIILISLVLEEEKCFSVLPNARHFIACLTWSPGS